MNQIERHTLNSRYGQTVLVLQGGGALGAYQAGVYEALAASEILPDWFAGISIGAINAAIMAGNEPGKRVEKLRAFWSAITPEPPADPFSSDDTLSRRTYAYLSSLRSIYLGIPGFFCPRVPPAWLQAPGARGATSFYDTEALRATLLHHVDFARINAGTVRLSLGAVNVGTGNFTYFDSQNLKIGPEHVMASGALPPGFPPIEVEGQLYWDGGLVSNTPLSYVLHDCRDSGTLIFQVDLFSASGPVPETMGAVAERRKDITYSSRTRMNTDAFRERHRLKRAISIIAERLPEKDKADPAIAALAGLGTDHAVSIVHLIYRRRSYDGPFKDFEFSRRSMQEHWRAGADDARRTLRAAACLAGGGRRNCRLRYYSRRSGVNSMGDRNENG